MPSTSPAPPTTTEKLQKLAVPAVCALIAFLSYSSQIVFYWLDPGPLSRKETIWINILICCIWTTYYKAVTTDPGRLPKRIKEAGVRDLERERRGQPNWCWKCDAVKPARAHHCRICKRCIPKMDHHCPWTSTCTSALTLPPFLRFLFYTVLSLLYFSTHLYTRLFSIYTHSSQPSYLGPPLWAVTWLFIVCVVTAITLFILTVLLVTSINSLVLNTTMIETWEIARHTSLIRRARKNGGYVPTPGGGELRISPQEFPYDIGIWPNICQGMGSSNPILWFLPWAGGLHNDSVWEWEGVTNGFEEVGEIWPPPDPEKIPQAKWQRRRVSDGEEGGFKLGREARKGDDFGVQAFRRRQEADYRKKGLRGEVMRGSTGMEEGGYEWLELEGSNEDSSQNTEGEERDGYDGASDSRYGWRNGEGERLADYGVDEEAEVVLDEDEVVDEDDVPLAELVRRRKGQTVRAT